MSAIYPKFNDREFDLVLAAAWNFYDHAIAKGLVGLNPPSLNDTRENLLKKTCYYTASLVP
jgi:hypothetical protein